MMMMMMLFIVLFQKQTPYTFGKGTYFMTSTHYGGLRHRRTLSCCSSIRPIARSRLHESERASSSAIAAPVSLGTRAAASEPSVADAPDVMYRRRRARSRAIRLNRSHLL